MASAASIVVPSDVLEPGSSAPGNGDQSQLVAPRNRASGSADVAGEGGLTPQDLVRLAPCVPAMLLARSVSTLLARAGAAMNTFVTVEPQKLAYLRGAVDVLLITATPVEMSSRSNCSSSHRGPAAQDVHRQRHLLRRSLWRMNVLSSWPSVRGRSSCWTASISTGVAVIKRTSTAPRRYANFCGSTVTKVFIAAPARARRVETERANNIAGTQGANRTRS